MHFLPLFKNSSKITITFSRSEVRVFILQVSDLMLQKVVSAAEAMLKVARGHPHLRQNGVGEGRDCCSIYTFLELGKWFFPIGHALKRLRGWTEILFFAQKWSKVWVFVPIFELLAEAGEANNKKQFRKIGKLQFLQFKASSNKAFKWRNLIF